LVSLLELTLVSLLELTLVSLLELTLVSLLELTLVSLLASELAAAGLLDLTLLLGRAWSLASGSAGFGAGALFEAFGAGALAACGAGAGAGALADVGAGWLLEPPFALFLSPSPLPPIWWSLL
jgi:hypothetical protein